MSTVLLENLAVMHMVVDVIEVSVMMMRRLSTLLLLRQPQIDVMQAVLHFSLASLTGRVLPLLTTLLAPVSFLGHF